MAQDEYELNVFTCNFLYTYYLTKEFLPELETYITSTFGIGSYKKPKVGPKSKNAQEGHEALRIVNPALTPEIANKYLKSELLSKVYELIWQLRWFSAK